MAILLLAVVGIIITAILGYFWLAGKYIDKAKVIKKKDDELHLD